MSKQYTQNNEESVAVIDGFQDLLNNYVQKDGSKVLSTNDYTTAEKNKLAGIAANANNFTYTLPTATSSVLGGVKVGSNITNSSGTISLTKDNVTSALGYTPPQSAGATYSVGTASALGLTKLYTGTGTNTDGTMTQSALKTALDGKVNTTDLVTNIGLTTTAKTTEGAMWVVWS